MTSFNPYNNDLWCKVYDLYDLSHVSLHEEMETWVRFVPWLRFEHFGLGIRTRVWPVLKGGMARGSESWASVTLLGRPSWVALHTQSSTGMSDTHPEQTSWLSQDLGPLPSPGAQPQNSVRRTLTVARFLEPNGSPDSRALDKSQWWHHIIPPRTAFFL